MTDHTSTDALDTLLSSVTSSMLVVSPFITMEAMNRLFDRVPSGVSLAVFTNWSPRAVRAGVTDPRIFSPVRSRGGRVLLHSRLHAKLFARLPDATDPGEALVGSANLTGPGSGWFGVPNLELLVPAALDEPHVNAFLKVLRDESVEAEPGDADLALRAAEHVNLDDLMDDPVAAAQMPPPLTVPPREFLMRLRAESLPEPLADLASTWRLTPDLDESTMITRIVVGLLDGPYYLLARAVARSTAHHDPSQQHETYRTRAEAVGIDVGDAPTEWDILMKWMLSFFPQRFQALTAGPTYLAEKFAEVSATF